jgi:Ca2+-transporting ATPase
MDPQPPTLPCTLSTDEVLSALDASPTEGLSTAQARQRLDLWGPNELPAPPVTPAWVRFLLQLREPMVLLLLAAAALSWLLLNEAADALAIAAIVALNAWVGFVQEGKATRALQALATMQTRWTHVIRDGVTRRLITAEVVAGDLVTLAAGDRVPADLHVLQAHALRVDESLLTGESLPVQKSPLQALHASTSDAGQPSASMGLAEQTHRLFAGTSVTSGQCHGVVVATGAHTELGKIAQSVRKPSAPTPLQTELGRLSTRLGIIATLVAAGAFGLSLLTFARTPHAISHALLASIALAIAAVPEGLATAVTIALALGVRRMAREGAIVRRLPAVETLGTTSIILTDKTGTLTENRLRWESVTTLTLDSVDVQALPAAVRHALEQVVVLCNDATVEPPTGDAMDLALLEHFAPERVRALRDEFPRIDAIPFDSAHKRMETLHHHGRQPMACLKGAPEVVLRRCGYLLHDDGTTRPLGDAEVRALTERVDELSKRGERIVACAYRAAPAGVRQLDEQLVDFVLVGLLSLRDPIRAEAPHTVQAARNANVRVIMVTGDHAGTARYVAEQVGLVTHQELVMTGDQLRRQGVPADPAAVAVYARVDPSQKLELVRALQAAGHVVAVTGDGVNDAPALKQAHIGVAMGQSGTDVARESADLVITDDNLATVITAIGEGRGIYENIRKVVDYLVGGNLSEILVVLLCLVLVPQIGVPLLPIQLLWINLLTDGLPALALGVDGQDTARIMRAPPRRLTEPLLGVRRAPVLMLRAALMSAACLATLMVARYVLDEPWDHARGLMFSTLVCTHLCYAFVVRASHTPMPINARLIGALAIGLGLQACIVLWPPAHRVFATARVTPAQALLVVAMGTLPLVLHLAARVVTRRATNRSAHAARQSR